MKKFRTPKGVSDYSVDDAYNKSVLTSTITASLELAGFCLCETGVLEYADLYTDKNNPQNLNKMFKLTDTDGSLLVLRPDATLQIARLATSKLQKGLHKLYYNSISFEFLTDNLGQSSRSREFSQIGIEILNANCVYSDAESVIVAINSLKAVGLKDFIIELGHVDFLNGLLADSNLNTTDRAELKKYISSKDALGAEIFLTHKKIDKSLTVALSAISGLYGDASILEKAKKLTKNKIALSAIANLQAILEVIKLAGFSDYVRIDLGLVKGGYYSGMVFKGFSSACGSAILDGGRYDLTEILGTKMFAVGFCIGTDRLMQALSSSKTTVRPPVDYAYINTGGASKIEFDEIKKLNSQNKSAIKLFADKDQLIEYCKNKKIKKAIVFTKDDMQVLGVGD